VRMHRPPYRSVWQTRWMNSGSRSGVVIFFVQMWFCVSDLVKVYNFFFLCFCCMPFSTRFLFGNYLDLLADACPDKAVLDFTDVRAAVTLARVALRVGSHIDVFCGGLFWEAVIVKVGHAHYRFRFLHTGRRRECGWIRKRDFLRSWRFPVRDDEALNAVQVIANCCSDEDELDGC
jgi:hypothetical protein